MDVSILVLAVYELFAAGMNWYSKLHQRVYKSGDKCYNDFCNIFLFNCISCHRNPAIILCSIFVQGRAICCYSKGYQAAASHSQIARRLRNPHDNKMLRLQYIVKHLKRKAMNSNARPRLLVTPEVLKAMKEVWQINSNHNKTTYGQLPAHVSSSS